jgi:hypothetical protein
MADVFYTILIVWVLWRIFGGSAKTHVIHHHTTDKKEGSVSINPSQASSSSSQSKTDKGEYVDFEEVK